MKKSIKLSSLQKGFVMLAAVLTANAHTANAENIQFQDENVKTVCVYYWDTDGDGELSYDEALQVKKLGSAFEGIPITSFDELQYFNGLEDIGDWAFAECTALKSITLPSDIKSIGLAAFYGCSGLEEINIPSNVSSIGKAAFKYCTLLKKLVLPESVKTIENNAFQYCLGMSSISLGSVQTIGERALAGCKSLKILYLPETVGNVGEYAFEKSGIITIDLSPNLARITPYMMAEMTYLTTVTLPYYCTAIDEHAFEGCSSLKSIHIFDYVSSIGSKAFNRCSSLKWVYINTTTPPTLAEDAFMTNSEGKYVPTLYVLEGYLDVYTSVSPWKNFDKYRTHFEFNFSKQYTSYAADFDTDFSDNGQLKVYTVTGCTENKNIILEELKNKYVPAYTGDRKDGFHGVLLFGNAGKEYTGKMGNSPMKANFDVLSRNLLVGCTNDRYIEPETSSSYNYILYDNIFKTFSEAGFISNGKAYLSLPKAYADEKGLVKENLYIDGESTDIFVIHEKDDNGNDKYYTIDGKEITEPVNQGMYIHNGKKILKKKRNEK